MTTPALTEEIQLAMEADRNHRPHRLAIAWCGEHDCRLPTCFPLHYPQAFTPQEGDPRDPDRDPDRPT